MRDCLSYILIPRTPKTVASPAATSATYNDLYDVAVRMNAISLTIEPANEILNDLTSVVDSRVFRTCKRPLNHIRVK